MEQMINTTGIRKICNNEAESQSTGSPGLFKYQVLCGPHAMSA